MRLMNANEVKDIQIQMYKYVASFCEEHGISYWIDSGSLIGTIRHRGFIPWDDDIDIGMLRPDFNRMIKEFNQSNMRYRFSSIEIDEDSFTAYGKVFDMNTILFEPDENGYKSHVGIDIFVYDNAPDDDRKVKLMYCKRKMYQLMGGFQHRNFSDHGVWYKKYILKFMYGLTNIFPKNYFVKKIDKNAKSCANQNTSRVGNFTASTIFTCNKRVFEHFVYKEFEGFQVRVPYGYDEWLTEYYGDYMRLPPIEKQVSHHKFLAYEV